VAALFSALVAVGLIIGASRGGAGLPLDDPRYVSLRQRLLSADEKQAPRLREELTRLDARLRTGYFQHLRFMRRGAWLLLVGVAATLLLAHRAVTIRRRLPGPKPAPAADADMLQRQWAQIASAAVVVFVAFWIGAYHLFSGDSFLVDRAPPPASEARGAPGADRAPAASGPAAPVTADAPGPAADMPALPPATPVELAANWPRFRGPFGSGISPFDAVLESWDTTTGEGVLWKAPVALPGTSSPVVWENRVFLTGATEDQRQVYCFDADSGRLLWSRSVADEKAVELEVEQSTGYAAPTPATDGRRVYAMFATGNVAAFDLDGRPLWQRDLGPLDNHYGHASSLATYGDRVIIQLDQGLEPGAKSKLLALDGVTGEVVWETPRPTPMSWSTPIVVDHEGQWRIITCAAPWVIAYTAEDGREIWRAACLDGEVGPSPVYADGVVYAANDNAAAVAIRDGGRGDVTESHVLWSTDFSLPDICSPLVVQRYVLLVAAGGWLTAYDRQQGGEEPLWEEDLGANVFASPALVGDHVLVIGEEGQGWFLKPDDSGVERLAENRLGQRCFASPVFHAGRIYVRGETDLFCMGTD
jgi:outer membrane protein assembly factor BamB